MAENDFQAPDEETRQLRDRILLSVLRSREQGFEHTAAALEGILATLRVGDRNAAAPDEPDACPDGQRAPH